MVFALLSARLLRYAPEKAGLGSVQLALAHRQAHWWGLESLRPVTPYHPQPLLQPPMQTLQAPVKHSKDNHGPMAGHQVWLDAYIVVFGNSSGVAAPMFWHQLAS